MNETQYQLYGVLPDTARSIWRYMDLAKYLSLLHSNALFFSQTKNLEDPYEGSLTLGPAGDFPGSDLDKYLRETQVYEYGPRSYTFVSCWHFNEIESAAMWQLYGYRNQGIAVRSSIDRLCQSMDISSVKGQIYVGSIVYGKVDNEPLAGDPAGRSETMDIFHKRPSFSHENEFRVVVDLIEHKLVHPR